MNETEKEALREVFREERRALYGPQRRSRRYDLAKDIWRARDQYRVENTLIGCGLLVLLTVCLFCLGIIVAATNYAMSTPPASKAATHHIQKGK